MKKVLYFTAGPVATDEEKEAITAIKADIAAVLEVGVRNGSVTSAYGSGVEAADYVAGSPPRAYDDVPLYSAGGTGSIEDGQVFENVEVTGTGTTATVTVVDGALVAIELS